jgi:steroid 5-alpha reductase family enzyme
MMQGLWVGIVTSPLVLVLNTKPSVAEISINDGIGGLLLLGLLLWTLGFLVECIADFQKLIFKLNPGNRNQLWIDSGLWSYARYPNYFGEMTLWWGFFAICSTGFDNNMDYLTIVSPIFVMILLLFVR